jgi:hypothetical protein
MADPSENYKVALANVESMLKKQEALNKSTDKLKDSWNAISSQVFGLDGAAFFKQVPLGVEDIKKLNDKLKEVNDQVRVLGEEFGDALDKDEEIKEFSALAGAAFAKMTADQKQYGQGTKEAYKAEMDYLKELREVKSEFANLSDDDLRAIGKHIKEGGTLSQIYDQLEETSKNIIKSNTENPAIFIESENAAKDLYDQLEKARKELEAGTKEAFSLKAGLQAAFSNVVADGLKSLMEFDKTINDVQKNTGIMMDANSAAFGDLTSRVAVFGVSAAKAGEYMTAMSDELDTTNFSVLSKAAEDFALIEGATGASADEITTIGGQLMRMGQSSEDVKNYMEDASNMAKRFGVNSKKAIGDISKNISKMRSMGFAGGEKSLAKMVITAQKLNMNVDEIFDVAKKARTIEGAMEMASELQLAGGSFANINPMDLLAAARGAPGELQKILNSMGKDVGKFNKETGEYEFDAVDIERLQMVADATDQTLDNVMNGIQKSGLDKVKLDPFKDMMGGLDEADKAMAESTLGDMMKFNKDTGKMELDVESDMAKKMGITDLDQINDSMITDMLKMKKEEDKTLEEQNARNQSFQESLTNFWMALQSIFSVFEPVLQVLTTVMQSITSLFGMLPGWSKVLIAGLLLFSTSFGASVFAFIGKGLAMFASSVSSMISGTKSLLNPDTWKNLGKSVVGGMKDAWGTVKDVFTGNFKKAVPGGGEGGGNPLDSVTKTAGESEKIKPTSGGGLKGFVEGLKDMSQEAAKISLKGIGKLALSMIMLAAPLGIMAALFAGIDPMLLLAFGAVLIEQAIALAIMSKFLGAIDIGNVFKGALAMIILGAAMIPFAYAAQMLGGIDWLTVLAGIGILALVMLGLIGLGALLMSPAGLFLIVGIAALIGVGLGLMVFGASMMVFAAASQMMQGMDFSWMSNLGDALWNAAPGLLLGGIALGLATPFLLFGSLGLMAISQAALVASQVDWALISGMGSALSSAAGGLFLFSLSAMMFTNPFVVVGMMIMVVAIAALAAVMVPLALSLQLGASSLTNFAIGLERLSAAADSLSDEKLAKLQKISEAMAKSSAAGNVAGAMASNAEAAGGGGAGGGGVRKIEVDVKLNGRELQNYIVKDTKIAK